MSERNGRVIDEQMKQRLSIMQEDKLCELVRGMAGGDAVAFTQFLFIILGSSLHGQQEVRYHMHDHQAITSDQLRSIRKHIEVSLDNFQSEVDLSGHGGPEDHRFSVWMQWMALGSFFQGSFGFQKGV